jgi:hypothetical protein
MFPLSRTRVIAMFLVIMVIVELEQLDQLEQLDLLEQLVIQGQQDQLAK